LEGVHNELIVVLERMLEFECKTRYNNVLNKVLATLCEAGEMTKDQSLIFMLWLKGIKVRCYFLHNDGTWM